MPARHCRRIGECHEPARSDRERSGHFGGKPIIRGMRISVELILSLLAQGETVEALMQDYPGLQADDIRACLTYAHAAVANDQPDEVAVTHA